MSRIALFGGSFNPPGMHHRAVVEALVEHFDKIIVVPCGPRPDKLTTNDVEPWHRAALTDITFRGLPKVEVDLFDLESASFTPNDVLQMRYQDLGEIWHVVGSDLTAGGGSRQSAIHLNWDNGEQMWEGLNFCVVSRDGYSADEADLPPRHAVVSLPASECGPSAEIRTQIFLRQPYAEQVMPEVRDYIERYGLYRGRIPARRTRWQMEQPRLLIEFDDCNERAAQMAQEYRCWEDAEDPSAILVLGGDGTMLRAIHRHWRRRVPFIGINRGHLGFLLNEADILTPESLPETEFVIRLMPMLLIEVESTDGTCETDLAFNDAWVERSSSQSAWLEVEVNGQVRIPKLVGDGALVCTAAGSTAYARSMGVAPLLADTPGWILAGSNVMTPHGWKSALLAPEASVRLRSLGGEKRPLGAFVAGQRIGGDVVSFHARQSRIATVEIVFSSRHDMAEKIAMMQFPSTAEEF
jgi:NAD+ kinase